MTTVVILLYGLGFVIIASAGETDPTTGRDVSIIQTISDIWNDKVGFSGAPTPAASTTSGSAPYGSTVANNPNGGPTGNTTYLPL